MTMPLSVTSTASVDPYASTGGMTGNYQNAPVYNKPLLDLANPLHLAALAGMLLVGVWAWKKKR